MRPVRNTVRRKQYKGDRIMKKTLVVMLLLGIGILGSNRQVSAAEGCASYIKELVKYKMLSSDQAYDATNLCTIKTSSKWHPQCMAYCASKYSGIALNGCQDGCATGFSFVAAN